MGNFRKGRSALVAVGIVVASTIGMGQTAVSADPPATVEVRGSAEQVAVTGLQAGESASLLDVNGHVVATRDADAEGGLLFRDVPVGTGYRVKRTIGSAEFGPVQVRSDAAAPWDPTLYHQPIAAGGYQYLTTRDGTKLAIDVHLPSGKGPYPTLIEYAGYGYANPAGPQSGLALLANVMGFAVVDVNMRGTGCSGGAFDFFEPLQQLDAYDVIETIASQPWVTNHQVGMFGISYGGISQLFAAQLDPPSLAAIAPLSVLDATPTTLYPGGILNTGFALSWAQGRADDAQPASPSTGQKWAWKRIQDGDTVCAANQALHGEAIDLIGKVRANSHYDPAVVDPLDPVHFVHNIKAAVFMACQWQDEQTGGHCPELVRNMTGTTHKWFTFTNGAHIDALDPATLTKLYDFLMLFVAKQAPNPAMGSMRSVAPLVYQTAMGVPDSDQITVPDDPIQHLGDYATALAAFEKLPTVTVRFENGAGRAPDGSTVSGNPYAAFEAGFSTLPVPGTQGHTWYLGSHGTLSDASGGSDGIDSYTSDATALPATDYTGGTGGGGLWGDASQWEWNWLDNPSGTAASYLTAPLAENTTVVGTGAVHLWVRSSTPDVDLQATISEVAPDGTETFVQNGWIRASERKLSTDSDNVFGRPSTDLDPIPTFTAADAAPMPADAFVPVSIPLYYQGHAYRAGSRIRVTIAAPNGSQPVWAFAETEPSTGTSHIEIARTPSMPSSLILPVVPGVAVPAQRPECPSLRNQPCRRFTPYENQSVELSDPSAPTTTTPTSSTPAAPTTTSRAVVGTDTARTGTTSTTTAGGLPSTGFPATTLLAVVGLLAGVGLGLVLIDRRRRRTL